MERGPLALGTYRPCRQSEVAGHDEAVHATGGQFAGMSLDAELAGGTGRKRTVPRVRTATVVEVAARVVVVAPGSVVVTRAVVVVPATVVGTTADGSV
jgi:hypothetical protein